MILRLFFVVFMIPGVLCAQDFTRYNAEAARSNAEDSLNLEREATLLVLPYHPHYHISEVDRMMTTEQMDASAMRAKLRRLIARSLTQALSDSLNAIDLSIALDEEIDICEYMYNALDYSYAKTPEDIDTPEKKRILQRGKLKKKEPKNYGTYVEHREGQLQSKKVEYDRFMTAQLGNKGAGEYLQDLYGHDALLSLTQIEITRSHEAATSGSYLLKLHYVMLNKAGKTTYGNKHVMVLSAAQLEWDTFNNEVLPALAESLASKLLTKMEESPAISVDNSDY
jgi:hypothetical protein